MSSTEITELPESVALSYQPTHADILTGVLTRDRLRGQHVVRWGVVVLLTAAAAFVLTLPGGFQVVPCVLFVCTAVLIWGVPRRKARYMMRWVSWQGAYRTTVGEAGLTVDTAHVSTLRRWSVFRGYRETRDHLVLFSRDPNILLVEVLPLRGLGSPEDADRLRAAVAERLPRL